MKRGFSLVEMLIYVAILAVMLLLIINTMLSFTGSYRPVAALRLADRSAVSSFDRATREIRLATAASVDASNATLNAITLTQGATTTRIYVDNGVVKVDVNSVYSGPLTLSGASVTGLTFVLLDSGSSKAVKMDMTVQGTSGQTIVTKNFHTTIVLKGI